MDLKKIALSLCALGLTGVASAGGFMHAPECNGQPVSVPCERSAWDIGVTGYWGRISSGHMEVDTIDAIGVNETLRVNPSRRFGFGLEGSYHWGNGNDVVVEWAHFNKSFEDRFVAFDSGTFVGADNDVINHANFKYDAINFELGQQLDVGSKWDMRVHAGLQNLRLQRTLDLRSAISGEFADGNFEQVLSKSRFRGLGPRAGFDSAYYLTNNWSVVGDAAASILSGRTKASFTENSFSNFVVSNVENNNYGHTYTYVAGLDGKLGVRYAYPISSGSLSFTGGYGAAIYMDPIVQTTIVANGEDWNEAYFGVGSFFLTAKYTS